MAKATREDLPVVGPPPFKVILELSQDEALVLRAVCERIGGAPETTSRGKMEAISKALDRALPRMADWHSITNRVDPRNSSIYFT